MTISLGIVLASLFAVLGTAKLVPVDAMRSAASHLGYSTRQYRAIGALELAAGIGTALGLAAPAIGVAAGAGLILLMLGATREHVVHRDAAPHIAAPILVAALATTFVVCLLR